MIKPPFLLEYRSEEVHLDGSFRPQARVLLSSDFGSCGLLSVLSANDLVALLLVLAGVTPSGGFVATPELIAPKLGVSKSEMRRRLERLSQLQWQGRPLLTQSKEKSGLRFFRPSPHLFEPQSNVIIPIEADKQARDMMPLDAQILPPSRREESIARSRQLYARPRAEVESEIKQFLSGHLPMDLSLYSGAIYDGENYKASPVRDEEPTLNHVAEIPNNGERELNEQREYEQKSSDGRRWLALKKRLFVIGLSHTQAKTLLDDYPLERIERQLEWLPHRDARNPVAYLLAAVAGDYAPPRSVPASTSPEATSSQVAAPGLAVNEVSANDESL